jgi:hypothetical protein
MLRLFSNYYSNVAPWYLNFLNIGPDSHPDLCNRVYLFLMVVWCEMDERAVGYLMSLLFVRSILKCGAHLMVDW